jgi:hypothetical protein
MSNNGDSSDDDLFFHFRNMWRKESEKAKKEKTEKEKEAAKAAKTKKAPESKAAKVEEPEVDVDMGDLFGY